MINVQDDNLRNGDLVQSEMRRVSAVFDFGNKNNGQTCTLHKKDRLCAGSTMEHSGRRLAYMRVSTPAQSTDRQTAGLQGMCDEFFIEHVSAVAQARPVFDTVLKTLRAGDTLVVWDLDRAFRSTIDALLTMEKLLARGINMHIVTMHLDTTTPEGELFYTILAGFAQYERRILSRRTKEGIEAARRKGKRIGRPPLLDLKTVQQAHHSITKEHHTCGHVARTLGVSRMTLQRAFRRYDLSYNPANTARPPTKRTHHG